MTTDMNEQVIVSNVRHFYTDPKDGKIKVKEFGDGTFEEIQQQINDFMKSIEGDN